MPNPEWPKSRVEIYTEPGYIDDNFRAGWASVSSPAPTSESLVNIDDIAGDYATHSVNSSGAGKGSMYQKDISAKVLSSTTYAKARIRVKKGSGTPRFRFEVETAVGSVSSFEDDAPDNMTCYEVNLLAGSTVKYLRIKVKDIAEAGVASVLWDYFIIEKATPFIPTDITFGGVANEVILKEFSVDLEGLPLGVSSCELVLHYSGTVSYPDVGAVAFVYAADPNEATTDLVQKLFRGRIKRKWMAKSDAIAEVHFLCEDFLGDTIDEKFSAEYATLTNLQDIVKAVVAQCLSYSTLKCFEATDVGVNATSNTIREDYKNYKTLDLLRKLAELSQWTGGAVKGGYCFLDVGGDLHFEKLGEWAAPVAITDSSIKRILAVERSIEGVVNDFKLIIEEESYYPGDENQFDETDEDANAIPDNWTASSDGTPLFGPVMSLETSNIKSGSGAARCDITGDPGYPTTVMWMRRSQIPLVNWIFADRLKFWMYRSGLAGLNADGVEVHLVTQFGLWANYYSLSGQAPPADGAWKEFNLVRSGWNLVNSPGDEIISIEIRFSAAVHLGTGYIILDKIRFVRDENAVTASDATSQGKYGVRKDELFDKTYTNSAEAQYWADNHVNSGKDPYTHVQIQVRGRAQTGFRPPQIVTLTITDVTPSIVAQSYQIIKSGHRQTPGSYACELEMHEADRLPLPLPGVVEFMRAMLSVQRVGRQEKKVNRWTK